MIRIHYLLIYFQLLLILHTLHHTMAIKYCDGRIIDIDYQLNPNQMSTLCSQIRTDDRFLFNVQRRITGYPDETNQVYDINQNYTKEANSIFSNNCNYFNICQSGYLISVFTNKKKIRITAGSGVSNVATTEIRDRVIDSMKPFLVSNDFYNAFLAAFQGLRGYKPITKITTTTTTTTRSTVHHGSGPSFWWILFFIVIVCLICCCCYYSFVKEQEENKGYLRIG